jgi:hypothetical protein
MLKLVTGLPPDLTLMNWVKSKFERSTVILELENTSVAQIEAVSPSSRARWSLMNSLR